MPIVRFNVVIKRYISNYFSNGTVIPAFQTYFLFGAVHILYNAREGGGEVDNLLYALYGGGGLY